MRSITKNIFTFEELTTEVQQKVIDDNRDFNVNYPWWVFAYDEIATNWANYGIGTDDHRKGEGPFYFNLGHGGFFYATGAYVADYKKLLRAMGIARRTPLAKVIDGNVSFSLHHFGGNNTKTDVSWLNYDGEHDLIEDELQKIVDDLCEQALSDLQREYDYLTSDESVRESIISNEMEFEEDGTPV